MGEDRQLPPDEQVRQLFGDAEKRTAQAIEGLVHRDSFGELLARVTENVMGITKIGFDVLDLTVRNLRLAGRPDLIRLGRQLARNEDKLERVLQEVETLQEEVRGVERARKEPAPGSRSTTGSSNSRRSSSNARSGARKRSSSSSTRSSNGSGSSGSSRSRAKSSG
jgi:uncharacterized membrane protein YgcG